MRRILRHEWKRVLLVWSVISLSACGVSQLSGRTEPSSDRHDNSSSGMTAPFSPTSDARKDVREAVAKLNSAYPYRLTETVSASTDSQAAVPNGTRVAEFAAADRVHTKSTGGIGGDIETITIGDRHYLYSGGKWTEGPLNVASNRGAEFAKKIGEMLKDVKYAGRETVSGTDCHLYSGTIDGSMGGHKWTGNIKIWIGAADGLPHQSDSDFKVGNSFSGKSHIVYEYGVNIEVEQPSL